MMQINPQQLAAAKQAVDQFAPVIGRYVAALIESGLSRAEAVQMAQALQQTVFQTAIVISAQPAAGA